MYIFDSNIEGVAERITQYGLRTRTFYSLVSALFNVVTSPLTSFWSSIMYNELPDKVFKTEISTFSELTGHTENYELPEDNNSLYEIKDISFFRLDDDIVNRINTFAEDDDEYDDDDCCDDDDCDCGCDCCEDEDDDDYDDPDTINLVGLDQYRGRD